MSDQWKTGDAPDDWKRTARIVGAGVLLVGVVLLVFLASFNVILSTRDAIPTENLPSLLFAAATLGILVLSVVLALVGVAGWRGLLGYVDRKVKEQFEKEESEYNARLAGNTGVLYGRVARKETKDDISLDEDHEGFLGEALKYTRKALRLTEDEERKTIIKNNLAFYLALEGDPGYSDRAKELADDVLRAYSETGDGEYLDTWAQVVLTYPGKFDEDFENECEAYRNAKKRLQYLVEEASGIPDDTREDARRHIRMLNRALFEECDDR